MPTPDALDRDRQLQRARAPGELPAVARRVAAGDPARDHGRRQRVDRRQRRGGPGAVAARDDRRAAHERRVCRRQQRRHPRAERGRSCCCSTTTPSCLPAPSIGSWSGSRRTRTPPSRGRGWSMPDGVAELSFGPMISPFAELRQKIVMSLHAAPRGAGVGVGRARDAARARTWTGSAARACSSGATAAEQAGLLDERFFLYTEDVDFCAAIRRQGRRVLFTPAAEIVHLRGRSRATAPAAMDAAYRRSHLAFYEKHHPRWAPLLRLYLRLEGPSSRGRIRVSPSENRHRRAQAARLRHRHLRP